MKCKFCGAEIANDSVYCEQCGKKIGKRQSSQKNKKTFLTVGIVAGAIAVIIVIVLLLPKNKMIEGFYDSKRVKQSDSEQVEQCDSEQVEQCDSEQVETEQREALAKRMVYSYRDEFYCDGVYDCYDYAYGFHTPELDINRNHFKIAFSFKITKVPSNGAWPMILGETGRILGLYLSDDGQMYITTNNQDNYYKTGIKYPINEYVGINMEYNRGVLTLNGQRYNIDMKTDGDWDNAFHSVNYSNGKAFKGYLKDVRIYNYSD